MLGNQRNEKIPCLLWRRQATLHLSAHALLAIGFCDGNYHLSFT